MPKAIRGNETNPKGFFEPRWVVNFHRRLIRSVGLRPLDQDPEALHRLDGVLGDQKIRDELHDWLMEHPDTFAEVLLQRAPWWTPNRLNDAVTRRVYGPPSDAERFFYDAIWPGYVPAHRRVRQTMGYGNH